MNAKEWLINKYSNEKNILAVFGDPHYKLMENYANYENKELHKKLMEWRENYLQYWSQLENNEAEFALYLLDQFDLHFNLREI